MFPKTYPLQDNHNVIDLTAFNTDGFDVSGKNVWIHDCTVWNQERNEMGFKQSENTGSKILNHHKI